MNTSIYSITLRSKSHQTVSVHFSVSDCITLHYITNRIALRYKSYSIRYKYYCTEVQFLLHWGTNTITLHYKSYYIEAQISSTHWSQERHHILPTTSAHHNAMSIRTVLYFVFCILYFVFCILYFVFCILYFIFCILYFIFYILYFVFYILYFIFCGEIGPYHCGDYDAGEDDDIFNVIYHLNNIRAPVMIYSRKVKQMPKVVRKTEPVHCTHLQIIIVI